jgi:hypothetical protein
MTTPSARTTSVTMAHPKPRATSRCGSRASSATLATPSMPRYSHIAKGRHAKAPPQPWGKPLRVKAAASKCGAVTAQKSSSSPTAAIVTPSSNTAAWRTPQMLSAVKTTYATAAIAARGTDGKNRLKYAPIAMAIAGGANRNSTSWATPRRKPPAGPNARRPKSKAPPARGIAQASSV